MEDFVDYVIDAGVLWVILKYSFKMRLKFSHSSVCDPVPISSSDQ